MKVGRQGQAKLVEGENGRRRGKRGRISGGGWGEGNIGRRIREGSGRQQCVLLLTRWTDRMSREDVDTMNQERKETGEREREEKMMISFLLYLVTETAEGGCWLHQRLTERGRLAVTVT